VELITFCVSGRFYNPSRVDPRLITHMTGSTNGKITLSMLNKYTVPALALSVVMVKESHLHTAHCPREDGKLYKSLTGKLLLQEKQLMESCILMALGIREAKGPIDADWLSFTCRPTTTGKSFLIFIMSYLLIFILFLFVVDVTQHPSRSKATTTKVIYSSLGSESKRKNSINLLFLLNN
jgi:hypothetical protein